MELNLANKPAAVMMRALRALLPPMRDHYGNAAAFRAAALPVLEKEAAAALADPREAAALADQAFRMITRLRSTYFRMVRDPVRLETVYKELDGRPQQPLLQQGCLWPAYRLQQLASSYLDSGDGSAAFARALEALVNRRDALAKLAEGDVPPTLERLEAALAAMVLAALGGAAGNFHAYAIAGHLLERARALARKPPELATSDEKFSEPSKEERVLTALGAAALQGELNEARARFAKFSPDETNRRFEAFKQVLLRRVGEVAPYGALGYEPLCVVLEAGMFPYPRPLEWIRSFVKPVYTNAAQSTTFDDCQTVQSVHQRYQYIRRAKQGNPVIVELAYAIAVAKNRTQAVKQRQSFIQGLDVAKEFNWPTTLEDLEARWAKARS
jgi:hypothetical protein